MSIKSTAAGLLLPVKGRRETEETSRAPGVAVPGAGRSIFGASERVLHHCDVAMFTPDDPMLFKRNANGRVVAMMDGVLEDTSAIEFTKSLCRTMGSGRSCKTAFLLIRLDTYLAGGRHPSYSLRSRSMDGRRAMNQQGMICLSVAPGLYSNPAESVSDPYKLNFQLDLGVCYKHCPVTFALWEPSCRY